MISIFNGRKRTLGGETRDIYIQVNVDIRDHLHLFKGALLNVFMAIALHADEEGWAFPDYSLLAKETGYGEDTIRRALADLCDLRIEGHRVLLRYQPKRGDGTFSSNHYLLFPSVEEVAEYEAAGVVHLGNQTRAGSDDRRGKNPPRSPSLGFPTTDKPTTENPTTKENHLEEQPSDDGGGSPVDNLALDEMLSLGVEDSEARKWVRRRDPELIREGVRRTLAKKDVRSRPGYLVWWLRQHAAMPAAIGPAEEEARYVACPGCGRLVHHDDLCPDCGRCYYHCHDEEGECLAEPIAACQ